ncbi:MFS transporter [Streptomyces uncialis]|uniref:MFS transporter n=1 Tax=Streptomyces uncialis TaxID=1048205 RepID=A0A1Q4UYZ4_9ACTN|nr:MFS transporter [Streptomyces uncialis]OKH90830.1 MFS transporter [Streptomyces uncialis]
MLRNAIGDGRAHADDRVPSAGRGRGSGGRAPLWLLVATACAGQFLVVLDVSVVNVALPSMRTALDMSPAALGWVVSAYSIAFAGFMLLGGRAGDLWGRRRMFLVGLALFTVASLAGGLAQEGWHLLAARAAQGLGAAVLAPATLTIVTAAVPEGPARARALATWTAVGAGGGAAGGFVGGALTDGLSWRWVLLVNVPVGVLVLAAAVRWIPGGRTATGPRRLDLPGALLVTAGATALAYGIARTETAGWSAPSTLLPFTAGLALLGVFLLVEARTREPLMPLGLFRSRAVASANAAILLCGSGMFGMWFFMTQYAQNVLGYSPLDAGLALIPSSLSVVVGAQTAPFLMRRFGARAVAVGGTLLGAAGFGWQSTMGTDGTYTTAILLPGILMSLGGGLWTTPLASLATSGAAPGDAGVVSGLMNTSRTLGGALGLSVLTAVATATTAGRAGPEALTDGYAAALRLSGGLLLAGAALMIVWLPRGGGTKPVAVPPADSPAP